MPVCWGVNSRAPLAMGNTSIPSSKPMQAPLSLYRLAPTVSLECPAPDPLDPLRTCRFTASKETVYPSLPVSPQFTAVPNSQHLDVFILKRSVSLYNKA